MAAAGDTDHDRLGAGRRTDFGMSGIAAAAVASRFCFYLVLCAPERGGFVRRPLQSSMTWLFSNGPFAHCVRQWLQDNKRRRLCPPGVAGRHPDSTIARRNKSARGQSSLPVQATSTPDSFTNPATSADSLGLRIGGGRINCGAPVASAISVSASRALFCARIRRAHHLRISAIYRPRTYIEAPRLPPAHGYAIATSGRRPPPRSLGSELASRFSTAGVSARIPVCSLLAALNIWCRCPFIAIIHDGSPTSPASVRTL